ncbi:MAG: hypothetical protein IJK38_06315 [Oscillospiraceae bacterium]|nr:hypothetical protein [Oscillospiraceae bacterium]
MKKILAILLVLCFFVPSISAQAQEESYESFQPAAEKAIQALKNTLEEERRNIYVYRDFGDTENHYTQKALMAGMDASLVCDMNENWQENPYSGSSCIRCEQITHEGDWGGWLFLNGYLPEGSNVPELNDGTVDGQGLDLSGAERLTFFARGEKGGEQVEFFTCGFGYNSEWNVQVVPFPDSSMKRSTGVVTLTREWTQFSIDLSSADMSSIVCGFGYVLKGNVPGDREKVCYLDEIRFEGDFSSGTDRRFLLRSYDTDNIYIQNAAFSYDNALTAMAFLSAGYKEEAEMILDAFVYAAENDRYKPDRIRNAYAAGDITAFPGWGGAARLPGWYDRINKQWYEDRYQTGSNVGNTSYVALSLLQYDALYSSERYLNTAGKLMDWVIDNCSGEGDGFTAGYDGWPEGGSDTTYLFTYKSIEHNIDAFAAFSRLYERTGEQKYWDAADSALRFVQSMYDEEKCLFYTGTLDDGITANTENIVLDAQVWACLALGEEFSPYEASLKVVEEMKTDEGGYPFCLTNANGGWWAEGTAYTALMYRLRGDEGKALSALAALESIQKENGLFPAATTEHLSTGFGLFDGTPWEYGTADHLAPTAWFIMAIQGFNPYVFQSESSK